MEIKHTFISKGQRYEISIDYMRGMQVLPLIPKEIGIKLFKNEEYIVQSQVQPGIFQNFLNYWQNSEEPEIISDNMYEYYLLSQEFGLMKEYFSEKCNEDDLHLACLQYFTNTYTNSNDNIQHNQLCDRSEHERYIAMNLDSFIEKNADQLTKVSTNSLFNIFFHKDRVLNNQQNAFNFINKNKEKNSNLSVLLPSLNAEELNQEQLAESLINTNENFGFIPKVSQSFASSYKEQIQDYQRVLNRLAGHFLNDKKNDIVKSILMEKCFDVNSKIIYEDDERRFEVTPLCAAILIEDIDLVEHLLARPKLDVNMKSIFKENISSEEKIPITLFADIEDKVTIENADVQEVTPLHLAIENANVEIVKRLIGHSGIDVNNKSIIERKHYLSQLEISPQALRLVKTFIKSPETILRSKEKLSKSFNMGDREEIAPLHFAIEKENIEIIKLLLENPKLDINITSLKKSGQMLSEIENKIIMDLINFDSEQKSALHFAIEKRNIEIIKLLFEHKELDVNMKSIVNGENSIVPLICIAFLAIMENKIPSLEPLFDLKITIDKQVINGVINKKEQSALHLAIEKGDIQIIDLILSDSKLNINDKAITENNCELAIPESEKLEIQEKFPALYSFLDDSVKRNQPKKHEQTALHMAVKKANTQIIKALLNNKNIDIEATDEQGNKPINLTNDQQIKSLLSK